MESEWIRISIVDVASRTCGLKGIGASHGRNQGQSPMNLVNTRSDRVHQAGDNGFLGLAVPKRQPSS